MTDAPRLQGSMRAIIPHPMGGRIIMAGFPGLETSVDGQVYFDPDACEDTIAGIKAAGAQALVVLVENDELDPEGFALLRRTADASDLDLVALPIEDFSTPSQEVHAIWQKSRAAREARWRAGGTLAFSCQYGAGRSGLMACLCLMEAGFGADEAMALVRSHFSQAVESKAQEVWLRGVILPELSSR